ncbi:hypothetical protein BE15_03615 [Sorangium cellulosum]|uniref:Uncharacterized protein n=2 Tax=Polyangiaceae TaxID=49 RepID=A0A150QYP7_SORCE|nr:hypothetical protein BE15_03615 [Sorangium cellulosum]
MEQLIDDLKRSVTDLENELASLIDNFGAQADFVADVRAWRANEAALERAILARSGVSLADQMKDSLNLWTGDGLDLEQTQLYETINAFAGAMSTVGEGVEAYAGMMQTLVHATTRIGVGFVPVVGPTLDLCEAVTGKAWCLPSGRELSDEERIFSGVGFGLGAIGPMWRGVTSSGLRPSAIRVAGEIAEIEEAFAQILKTNRVRGYKTLTGAITKFEVDIFEKKAAKFLVDDGRSLVGVGDDGVREVVGIPKHSSPGGSEGAAPDFVSISRGHKLIISEAKGGTIPVDKVRKQLSNAMKALKEKRLDGDVARVELIMEQGADFNPKKFTVKDGYLFDSDEGKTVTLDGFNNFIMVIRL